jgi:hypothetical protein
MLQDSGVFSRMATPCRRLGLVIFLMRSWLKMMTFVNAPLLFVTLGTLHFRYHLYAIFPQCFAPSTYVMAPEQLSSLLCICCY